jgi:hypothetical protein
MTRLLIDLLKRAAIGFAAGFLIACFVLVFLGHLPPHGDLSQPELEQQTRSLWLALYVACAVALLAAAAGRRRLSKFWLWSCVAFGVVCMIPFWPSKSGKLLPLATPYVNFGFRPTDVSSLLAIHVGVALAIAATIQWVWPLIGKRRSRTGRPT